MTSTGGVIGLWPYRSIRHGVRTVAELVAHARHIASLVGPEHLAIGTDMNGVPRLMVSILYLTMPLAGTSVGPRSQPSIAKLNNNAARTRSELSKRFATLAFDAHTQAGRRFDAHEVIQVEGQSEAIEARA